MIIDLFLCRQKDRRTEGRKAERWSDAETERCGYGYTNSKVNRQTERQTEIRRDTERHRKTQRERETDTYVKRHCGRERER
jgi:hypothetical protein